ncbi:MAG: capsular biosynthesis protein [Cyclobacteriaceae bacterium]|nr:capsular biosynthesis protein [Cyclobacteriaceae bacterium]
MLNWFRKKKAIVQHPVWTDIHSHLLPGLDDGVKSFEDAEKIILRFIAAGYKKLITTPHIMSDAYRNTPEGIRTKLNELKEYLHTKNISIELEAAAEYYLDEVFIKNVEQDRELLTFGKRFLLFETNFMTEPLHLKEFIFMATTNGHQLVLAHPERYIFLQNDFTKAEDLINRGVYFQINIASLTGYYSREAQRTAFKLIDKGWVHFLGSDCHSLQHIRLLEEAQAGRYYQKALSLPLLNNTL